MPFKINKGAKFSVNLQPRNTQGATQLSIDNLTLSATSMVPELIKDLADNIFKDFVESTNESLSEEGISALQNKYVSKAFEDLYQRGVNPLRPEVLFVNEYVPLATGEDSNNATDASINLNYGEGTDLQVNQVMRLIDLQRVIRKQTLKVANMLLNDFYNLSERKQKKIIKYMHRMLKSNIKDFMALAPHSEKMVDKLIEICTQPEMTTITTPASTPRPHLSQTAPSRNSLRTNVATTVATSNIQTGNVLDNIRNSLSSGSPRQSALEDFNPDLMTRLANSENTEILRSLARYVIFDYIVQNSISFITRIFDLKDLLAESISIAYTELPKPENHSNGLWIPTAFRMNDALAAELLNAASPAWSSNTANSSNSATNSLAAVSKLSIVNRTLLNSIGTVIKTNRKTEQANELLNKWGHVENLSSTAKHDLSKVLNARTNGDNEEAFGSNRHMYANLFANMLKAATFTQTLNEEETKPVNKNKIAFTSGTRNLANGIKILKSIKPGSMCSSLVPNTVVGSASSFNGQKVADLLTSVSDDPDVTLIELMAAVCYDQVAGANIMGGAANEKLLAPTYFKDFKKLESLDNILIQYFNNMFFNTGVSNWNDLTTKNNFDYSQVAADDNNLGEYFKSRFKPKEDSDGTKYVPNEYNYEDNVYREDTFLIATDYYFNKALTSEELNFDELTRELDKIEKDIDVIVHDLTVMLGLDFDADGNPEYDLNGYAGDSNPLTYFNSWCDAFADQINHTIDKIGDRADIVAPLIQAGNFSDKTFVANVIKASFHSNLANTSNNHMIMNFEKVDGEFLEPNLIPGIGEKDKKEGTRDEATSLCMAESEYLIEEKVWYKLWSGKLKNLLKDGKPKYREAGYALNSDKKYKAILHHDASSYGTIADPKEENSEGKEESAWYGTNIGSGFWSSDSPGFVEIKEGSNGVDGHFEGNLNFPDDLDLWAKIAIAVVVIAVAALAILSGFGVAAGSTTFLKSLGTFFTGTAFTTVTGTATATAIQVTTLIVVYGSLLYGMTGIGTLIAENWEERDAKARPQGVSFSKSGYFESLLLSNALLIPPSLRPETKTKAESEEFLTAASASLFGMYPNDNYMLRPRPGNGNVMQYDSISGLVDKLVEAGQAFLEFFGADGGDGEGTVPEEDIYKPFYFEWNNNAGNYGGIFKTNTASRFVLFNLFFSRVLNKSVNIRYAAYKGDFYAKYDPTGWKAVSDALKRQQMDPRYSENGEYSQASSNYRNRYNATREFVEGVTKAISYRRSAILNNLLYLKQNVNEIKEAIRRSESILSGRSTEIPTGEKVALSFLKKYGFAKSGFVFLNDNTAGTLLQNYQRHYMLDFTKDNSDNAPEGISTFPFFKKESYDVRELKMMAKIFSEKNRSFTSHKDDNLGRKTIIHVGIPMGMIRALQNEAYQKTGEIEYYYSNNIAIHITKKNDLTPGLKYQSRTFVFNTSKYITPFKGIESYDQINEPGNFKVANHLENYIDTWGIEDIKSNVEVLTVNRKNPVYGIGLEGIKAIDTQNNLKEEIYDDSLYSSILENHIYDYYSKLYTESTTGINIDETLFPLDKDHVYDGKIDDESVDVFRKFADELTFRFPASNIIPAVAQEYYRVLKASRSSLYFSSESRFKSCLSTQCFQRIFSIPISERDFLLKQSEYNMAPEDIYDLEKMPRIQNTSRRTGVSQAAIANLTGLSGISPENDSRDLFNLSPARATLEYSKVLNSKKTDVSSFIIEIALLKSSKVS